MLNLSYHPHCHGFDRVGPPDDTVEFSGQSSKAEELAGRHIPTIIYEDDNKSRVATAARENTCTMACSLRMRRPRRLEDRPSSFVALRAEIYSTDGKRRAVSSKALAWFFKSCDHHTSSSVGGGTSAKKSASLHQIALASTALEQT